MSEVKWIKLSSSLPTNKKIKQIRKLPNGDSIALMWVFILCLAGETNDNGMVYFTRDIPYTEEMLATEFEMDVNTIRLGLSTFQKFGMIEIVEDIILLSSWERWQAVDKLSELREYNRLAKQRSRQRQKERLLDSVNDKSLTCQRGQYTDKDIDIDKEIDINTISCSENDSEPPQEEKKTKTQIFEERFEIFWKAYPRERRTGKGNARKIFVKLAPSEELLNQMLSALELAKQCDQWTKDNGRYIPMPATWLNQSRWEDEYFVSPVQQQNVAQQLSDDEAWEQYCKKYGDV